MKRRNVAVAVVAIVGVIAIVFFLPLIPVKVEDAPCPICAGLFIEEQGHSSMGLYFFGYGGIYLSSLPNFPNQYVGYCVVYGSPYSTSCGVNVVLLNST
jgi:hypothetical protein